MARPMESVSPGLNRVCALQSVMSYGTIMQSIVKELYRRLDLSHTSSRGGLASIDESSVTFYIEVTQFNSKLRLDKGLRPFVPPLNCVSPTTVAVSIKIVGFSA